MLKLRYFSVYSDFKTSAFSKLFFSLAALFIIAVVFIQIFALFLESTTEGVVGFIVTLKNSSFMDISLAMIILFLGAGLISLFFHHQFKKLAEIADELEKLEETDEA